MNLKQYFNRDPSLLLSEKRIRSLLSDIYMTDRLSINLLVNAFSIGIVSEMRDSFPVDQFTISRWTKKLVGDYGVSSEKARWAIDIWISAIDKDLLTRLDDAERQLRIYQENLRKQKEDETRTLAAVERAREEEKNVRERTEISTHTSSLKTRADYNDFYINPKSQESQEFIYIPCGFGQGDNGFLIYGIRKEQTCKHKDANVYALVYNYLIRNSTIREDDIPFFFKDVETIYELDFQSIYRLAIIILQLIRHNRAKSTLTLNYRDDTENLRYAISMINNYAAIFSRLIGIPTVHLQYKVDHSGIPISLHGHDGIYIKNNTKIVSNARELWYGRKINYHLSKDNLPDLEYILHEISGFDRFKEGQFSALCDMLACKKHSVCIMPTGSGKSLIFYFASLLQPLPLFVVSPTDILIQDQIRNLKEYHRIDNVAHLQLTSENSFSNWDICNSLNYLTPMTFQNRNLLVKFRYLNAGTILIDKREERIAPGALVSYIVLDEIHCLSHWGHDFRPEYLMLSRYLNKFFDHISFLGFTATANYTVVEDVQKQLSIPQDNFFSPIAFEHFNVSYDFRVLHTEEEMLKEVAEITAPMISSNERTIVFTKNDNISERVADVIGWEADVYLKENPSAYYHFADGKSKILVASDELGIGINLPDIRNVIHFGLPLSKNEYVQEIGRAGRANEKVKSYVLFLDNSLDNVPEGLLNRSTPIKNLPSLLEGYSNDYTHIYQKLSNGAISDEELYGQLIQVYHSFVNDEHAWISTVRSYSYDILDRSKQQLYMLYLTGFINDWYSYSLSKDKDGVDIFIDVCSTNADSYRSDSNKMLNRMKERLRSYFEYLGNNRESIAKVSRAKSPEEIIHIYVKWYYEQYLFHHNEQFLDFFEFITANAACDSDKITEDIKDYFVLPFAKIKSDESLYNDLSISEIIEKTTTGVSKSALVNLERINSNRYSVKFDIALFCGQLRMYSLFDGYRLDRILSRIPDDEIVQLGDAIVALYPSCNTESKIKILNYMKRKATSIKVTYEGFLDKVYNDNFKDEVYYGVMADRLNKRFHDIRRLRYV